ncbi:hypothetical protein ACQY0O_007793 [Thecaphora frezii]
MVHVVAGYAREASVAAHGYVSSPPSRAALCKQEGSPTACGAIQYEPQSVEAPKGLPFSRTNDGHLCSAGVDRFPELDRQGATAWKHQKLLDAFQWNILVPHATTDFKYFITKPDWDSNKKGGLMRSDLEEEPFLQVKMNGKVPGNQVTHKVANLPDRKGYHMVYAVWTIDNTANAFYQCIDLDFGGSSGGDKDSVTDGDDYSGSSSSTSSQAGQSSESSQSSSSSTQSAFSASSSQSASSHTSSSSQSQSQDQYNDASQQNQTHHANTSKKPAFKGKQHYSSHKPATKHCRHKKQGAARRSLDAKNRARMVKRSAGTRKDARA